MCRLLLTLILASVAIARAPGAWASVTPELQQAIRASTFEVVMKKPEKDSATYEKPLPLNLLPYRERNDSYQSIGTAFSLGHDTYVTAAHVIAPCIDGQYGMPELRGSDGTVYPIDRITRFSQHEDFVIFSLVHDPAPQGFLVDRNPKIDDPVLAVGNAFGEGIVIRDGLYTSATDEDQDGRWKWIRFSAAASPGNSGGPLLDADGKVIGIVIGKSPNENLNFSLPIARALDAQEHRAGFDQRVLTSLPYLHGTYTYAYRDGFDLPLTWPAFVAAFQALVTRHTDEAREALLNTYKETAFPKGPGSDSLLFDSNAYAFRPFVIAQQADGAWAAQAPDYSSTALPGDGSVDVAKTAGATFLRLVRSDRGADDAFYGDSKSFMDLALKALNLNRSVGPDQVRMTSLGSALTDELFVDPYGRRWQERVWPVPFLNVYVVGLLLPTPDGYAAILQYAPSALLQATKNQARLLTGQVGISLSGSLRQWQLYLHRKRLLPNSLSEVTLAQSADWVLHTPRFVSAIPPSLLPLTDKSPLTLTMGFTGENSGLRWDIVEVWWSKDERMDASVGLVRRARPPGTAKLELRNEFDSMRERRSPYDGQIVRESAESYSVSRVLDVPGKNAGMISTDVLYGLTVRLDGHPTVLLVDQSVQSAVKSNQILEHGLGNETSAPRTAAQTGQAGYSDAARQAISTAEQTDAAIGKDIRGHLMSQDVRDFYEAHQQATLTTPIGTASADSMAVDLNQQYQALGDYWHKYPGLTHNRDLWTTFLSRNGMSPTTPHDAAVKDAESALLAALATGTPSPEWSSLAQKLGTAYVQERNHALKTKSLVASDYRSRTSPCMPPAVKTTGKAHPAVARMNRSLEEFWPLESKRLSEEGLVMVSLRVSSTGCAVAAAIAGSSGSAMLDETVMQFYETIDFTPAEIDGKAAEATVILPVNFKLTN